MTSKFDSLGCVHHIPDMSDSKISRPVDSSLATAHTFGVSAAPCPYQYGHGINILTVIGGPGYPLKAVSIGDWLIHYIVGAGQLFDRSEDNPFKSFCHDDTAAIASDWSAVGNDLWHGVLRAVTQIDQAKPVLNKYLTSLEEKQLELFTDDR